MRPPRAKKETRLTLSRDVEDVIGRAHRALDPAAAPASTQRRVDEIVQRQRLDILAYLAVCELRLFRRE
jgi:hypothetical protein